MFKKILLTIAIFAGFHSIYLLVSENTKEQGSFMYFVFIMVIILYLALKIKNESNGSGE